MKKYSLPKEFAEKWVEALRSCEYEQIKDTYTGGCKNQFCANGLAYHIAGIKFGGKSGNTPLFNVPDPLTDTKFYKRVLKMNDRDNKTFPEIADWIEQNVNFI